jgi:cation diffusion facilitator CzcD-associated flavoprotein CzcO
VGTENGDRGDAGALSVGIVGAGFGGVGMGIRLRQAGVEDFTIFERGDSVGGVWRANTYPGAACDVPSHLYSFSFAPGHDWTRRYAPQAEILSYLERITDEYGIRPHVRLGTEATRARFDPGCGRWVLTTDDGREHSFDLLVTAVGQLTRPAVPDVPGVQDFKGPLFHSAEWDHGVELAGRRVAVIGTGASAIQFIPEIAREAAQVDVYQRSAPWVLPKLDRAYPEWERRLFERFPPRVAASRLGLFGFFEVATYAFTGRDWVMRPFVRIADSYRERELPDPELRARATPDYAMGCKRILFTSDWYSTLRRRNVGLLDGAVERITPGGVVGADGVERPADVVIWGTGFQAHNFVAPMEIHGLEGRELTEVWAGAPSAYLGTVVSGFPNMFVLYGPNTNHGSGSVPYTLECQFNYVLDAIRRKRERGLRWLDLRPETQAAWDREVAERSVGTVWTEGGCTSWYVTDSGRNTNNWPGPWLEYRRRTRRIDPGEFRAAA